MYSNVSDVQIACFQELLLKWFHKNGRSLPWRNSANPYHNLVAEFLLQKTNAEKVEPVYNSLIVKYPTVADLASADQSELMTLLTPLGLFYRAERLLSAVQIIVKEYAGHVPNTLEQLKKLLGVGDYMANAVLCFAFGEPRPLIDTNSARVLSRIWGISLIMRPRTDRALWNFATQLVPNNYSKEYNWALIDLAHFICSPKKPKHGICPILPICVYAQYSKDQKE